MKYILTEEDGFTPTVIDEKRGYGVMVVSLRRCKYCKKWMLHDQIFPPQLIDVNSKKKQIDRAGWKKRGYVGMQSFEDQICEECVEKDIKKYPCVICGKEKKAFEIKVCIGYPAEYLCKECYAKVPAKEWDKKVDELEEKHKWDNE